ncbi:MAG TPA: AAA family ATPase [Blastocatellia bacterium]|jgi:protein phosphatase|nr:AAA family ATPase [Blastocatellia bacterium]
MVIPRNSLVVLCGPAGCGKSTFAAKHFLPTQVVASDDCRAQLSDDPSNQEITELAFQLMHFIVERRLLLGRLTVADATHLKREDRRPLVELANRFGFNLAAIVINVSLDVCLARNERRARTIPLDAIVKQHALLQPTLASIKREGFHYVFVLDEKQQELVQVEVGSIVRRYRTARRSRRPKQDS